MFGGLDIKGGGSKEEEQEAAAPSSGFSFLNTTATTTAASSSNNASSETPVESSTMNSGFSFLNSVSAPPAEPEIPAPSAEPSGLSGFSFLQPETTTEPHVEPPTSSGFDFLMSSTTTIDPPTPAEPEPTVSEPPASAPEASSGFDFLMSMSVTTTTETPAASLNALSAPVEVRVRDDIVTPPAVMAPAPATTSSLLAGTGITFGTAAKRPGGVKKKKSRAARVGMGANTVTSSSPLKKPQSMPESKNPTHDNAQAANQRAEDFLQEKQNQEKQNQEIPEIYSVESNDSILQQAEQAAKEAQKAMQSPPPPPAKSGFMGTFFKGFGGNSSSNNTTQQPSSSNVDRVAKQQEDMKRAAAERQMKQLKAQSKQDVTNDNLADERDKEVTASFKYPDTLPSEPAVTKKNIPDVSHFQPPVPPLKKKKTPQELFDEYRRVFRENVKKAIQQVENVRATQRMLVDEKAANLQNQSLVTQQICQTEEQINTAVQEEDYELADQLSLQMKAHQNELTDIQLISNENVKALEHLNGQKEIVSKQVATCFTNLSTRLSELKDTLDQQEDNDTETFSKFEAIAKQLSAEQERLQQDAKHLERDELLVREERNELEVAISEQSGVLETQRDDTASQLADLEIEMEDLRQQLAAKQSIAANLRTKMHGLEDSIDKVRVKFSRQLTRVDKKERSLQENRNEWQAEQLSYEQQKEAHELQVQSHSESMLIQDNLLKVVDSELILSLEFSELIPEKVNFLKEPQQFQESDNSSSEDSVPTLQTNVTKSEAAVSEAKIVLQAANTHLEILEQTHASLLQKIPLLETQKKTAAASRDFKAASKASKEIKDATLRLKECEEELVGDASTRQAAAKIELEQLEDSLAQKKSVLKEKESISAVETMKQLADKISVLKRVKDDHCGADYLDNSVQEVGALVLQGQIKSLEQEGKDLGDKYGGWDELLGAGPEISTEKTPEQQPEEVDGRLSLRERILKVRDLLSRISQAEQDLEEAAAREDFDQASELHDLFQELQQELESITLSETEMELAMSNEELSEEEVTEELPEEVVKAKVTAALKEEEKPDTDDNGEELDTEKVDEERTETEQEVKGSPSTESAEVVQESDNVLEPSASVESKSSLEEMDDPQERIEA